MIESASNSCPDASVLDAYVSGGADDESRLQLDAHLDACDECRRVVSALAPAAESSSDAFAPTVESQPPRGPGEALSPGQVLLGKYEVETLLGAGGMGVVARARHKVLDRPVVIKLLKAPHASDEAIRRFLREARAGAAIDSANVVRVIDAGLLDEHRPYLVLEHLEGRDLAEELAARGALPVAEAVELGLQCAEALALAHARGIVHRDIKPANLFLSTDSEGHALLKVLDFGIAKALSDSDIATQDVGLTDSSSVIGSPRYMSPEQLEDSSGVDERTDIWSLGAVLYELVAGRPAFDGPSLPVLATKILTQPPAPLRSVAPDVPSSVADVIARCLDKDRDKRFGTASELADALLLAADLDDSARAARIRRLSSGETLVSSPGASASDRRRSPPWLWVALAALLAIAIAVFLVRRPSPQAMAPDPVPGIPSAAVAAQPSAAPPPAAKTAPPPSAAPQPSLVPAPQVRRPSQRPPASAKAAKPAASGVNVYSDGLLDRK